MNARSVNLEGRRFGRLVVMAPCRRRKFPSGQFYEQWPCRCDCGAELYVRKHNLVRAGKYAKRDCGCARREARSQLDWVKHRKEYDAWQRMCNRFRKPGRRNPDGAVKVCERWLNSFQDFLADVGRKPSPEHVLVRLDHRGEYSPENARWGTATEKARASRWQHRTITFNGETLNVTEWAKRTGIHREVLWHRVNTEPRWSAEKALTTATRPHPGWGKGQARKKEAPAAGRQVPEA